MPYKGLLQVLLHGRQHELPVVTQRLELSARRLPQQDPAFKELPMVEAGQDISPHPA